MNAEPSDAVLRAQLLALLKGGNAHMTLDHAVVDFPMEHINTRPPNIDYTPWHLLEHIRIAQWDILDFIRNPDYKHIKWPDDYWPADAAPPSGDAWDHAIAAFREDLEAMVELLENPATDLFAPIPWGSGQTVLREALLVADHNAYHLGQIVDLRRALGCWPPGKS